jgi:hypothetical protein
MMTEQMKAILKLVLNCLVSAAGAAQVAITAAGQDNFDVFANRPSVWIGMFMAVGPVLLSSLTKSPAQGAAMDQAIEQKADAKAEAKIQTLMDTGTIRRP